MFCDTEQFLTFYDFSTNYEPPLACVISLVFNYRFEFYFFVSHRVSKRERVYLYIL